MKRALIAACVGIAILVVVLSAQAPPQAPKPGPEQKRIGYFAGNWTAEGEMKESPFGPAGKATGTDHNEWLPGGFFLLLHEEFKGPMGSGKGLSVIGYNRDEKVYTFDEFNSMGIHETAKGTVKGDTWTWTGESKMGGKLMKSRFTIKELPPASYTFKFESSTDGKTWSTVEEGKATKTK